MLTRSKASKLRKLHKMTLRSETLSAEKKCEVEKLDHSDFESAIINNNLEKVKELFSKGHKLCIECWSTHLGSENLKLVRVVLKHDNSFINQPIKYIGDSYPTVLMAFCCEGHCSNDIKFLLNQGADVNALDEDGKNALFYAVEREKNMIQLLRTLIEAGADPHVRDNDGYTLLHRAINNVDYDIDLLKFLIEEIGIDPLVNSNDNTSVLATAIERYFCTLDVFFFYKENHIIKTRYEAMRYLFDNFQNGSNDPSSQIAFLSNLHVAREISDCDFFFTNQFMNGGNLIVERRKLDVSSLPEQYFNLGGVGIFLNSTSCDKSNFSKTNHFLEKYSSLGFSINDPPNCLSPLVILIESYCFDEFENVSIKFVTTSESATSEEDHDDLDNNKLFQLVKKFVESEAYVGLRIMEQHFGVEELNQLAEEILLPDVFFVLTRMIDIPVLLLIMRYLLPHLGAPPLALALCVHTEWDPISPQVLIPILFEFGPVPPGTRLLAMLRRYFETLADKPSNELICQAFEEMHSSPPSLMQLCRSQIRMSIAAQMPRDRSGPNLPDLIATLTKIPPPLIKYLQMWPQEPMNVVVCENQEIADRANTYILLDIDGNEYF